MVWFIGIVDSEARASADEIGIAECRQSSNYERGCNDHRRHVAQNGG